MTDNFIEVMKYVIGGVSFVAIAENLLAIAVFAGTKKLRIKYYTFVVNLALSDFLFAVLAILYRWFQSPVLDGFVTAAYIVSIMTIMAAAINRYLALSLMPPARYDSLVTGYRLIGVCIMLWVSSLLYGLLIFNASRPEVFNFVQVLGLSLSVFIFWFITAVVYFLAFRKIKQYAPPLASAAGISANEERDQTRVKQTRRLLVLFVLILVVSFISWAPAFAMRVIVFFNPSLWADEILKTLLYTLSTAINPLLYWFRLDGFREGFYAMFCRCVTKAEPREIEADPTTYDNTVAETGL
ncbi:adenosine receptor A2b-like [Patiria miniata]|uniref:G-protein coupled receptors family 1 profile domain-containing protein n=1 Tax=Patiria miniata TaxID=46514 RepID=A0A914AMS0_PATMI|nr:adenosine receptor A2b-like [Patiria miniata]